MKKRNRSGFHMVAEIPRREEEPQIDVVFPDNRVFRGYARLLSVPYAGQRNQTHYSDLSHCPCHYLRMDAEVDFAREFQEMSWDDRVQALREMKWGFEVAVWLVPVDHRCTIGDLLSRRGSDLDLGAKPFTYTEDDWKKAWFRVNPYTSFLSAVDMIESDRIRAFTREEKIQWLEAWRPGTSELARDLKPCGGIDAVDELVQLAFDDIHGVTKRQLAVMEESS